MTRWPRRDSAAAACISSVDLPMPGSPPISTAAPPSRVHEAAAESAVRARPRPFFGVFAGPPPIPPIGSSSTMVFHSPQPSHLPAQRLWMVLADELCSPLP
jgi:hypothetical protein